MLLIHIIPEEDKYKCMYVCMYVLHTTFVLAANIPPFYCDGYMSGADESISDDIFLLLQVRNACMYDVCLHVVMYVCMYYCMFV